MPPLLLLGMKACAGRRCPGWLPAVSLEVFSLWMFWVFPVSIPARSGGIYPLPGCGLSSSGSPRCQSLLEPLAVPSVWEGAGHSRTMSPFSPSWGWILLISCSQHCLSFSLLGMGAWIGLFPS